MITIYGISSCDTMQKAMKWLDSKAITYKFHNYREAGIAKSTVEVWLQHFPANKLINTKSTTFRELESGEKDAVHDSNAALNLMLRKPTLIKRPVWDFGNGTYYLGWNETEITKKLQLLP